MASKEENLKRFQEIADRGLQDQLPSDKRAIFDEAVRRGLINTGESTEVESVVEETVTPDAAVASEQTVVTEKPSFLDKVSSISSGISDQINRSVLGLGESALAVGGAAIGEPVSGLMGMAAALPSGKEPAEMVSDVQDFFTYQPRTQAGQQAVSEMGTVLEPVGKAVQAVEQGAGEIGYQAGSLISDEVGAATGAIFSAIPTAIMEVIGFKGSLAAKVAKLEDAVKTSGVSSVMTPEAITALKKQGINEKEIARNYWRSRRTG